MVSLGVWVVIGLVTGWAASTLGRHGKEGEGLYMAVAILGAMIGGWLLAPMFVTHTVGSGIGVMTLIVSIGTAVAFLIVLHIVRVSARY